MSSDRKTMLTELLATLQAKKASPIMIESVQQALADELKKKH